MRLYDTLQSSTEQAVNITTAIQKSSSQHSSQPALQFPAPSTLFHQLTSTPAHQLTSTSAHQHISSTVHQHTSHQYTNHYPISTPSHQPIITPTSHQPVVNMLQFHDQAAVARVIGCSLLQRLLQIIVPKTKIYCSIVSLPS